MKPREWPKFGVLGWHGPCLGKARVSGKDVDWCRQASFHQAPRGGSCAMGCLLMAGAPQTQSGRKRPAMAPPGTNATGGGGLWLKVGKCIKLHLSLIGAPCGKNNAMGKRGEMQASNCNSFSDASEFAQNPQMQMAQGEKTNRAGVSCEHRKKMGFPRQEHCGLFKRICYTRSIVQMCTGRIKKLTTRCEGPKSGWPWGSG